MIKITLDKLNYTISDIVNILKENNINISRQSINGYLLSPLKGVKFTFKGNVAIIPVQEVDLIISHYIAKRHQKFEIFIKE